MKQRSGEKIKLLSVDDLLGVPVGDPITEIEVDKISSFEGHPFKVIDDEKMKELVESILGNGVLTPVLVRPDDEGGYEMISGHRRLFAVKEIGLDTIPAYVREMTDTSQFIYGYTTHIFDNNFYTGYQAWSHGINFSENYLSKRKICPCDVFQEIELNKDVARLVCSNAYILTSGDGNIWNFLARRLGCECFWGTAMSADTKYFVVKKLREAGKYVIAYGDSMNDYYMLREADEGYLIAKRDGTISRSLKAANLGGVHIVRT